MGVRRELRVGRELGVGMELGVEIELEDEKLEGAESERKLEFGGKSGVKGNWIWG